MRALRTICVLSLLVVVASAAAPQEPPSDQATLVESVEGRLRKWVTAMNEFIGEVRLTEADAESFVTHWVDFALLEDKITRPLSSEKQFPFELVLEAAEYREWATKSGLDPDGWLRRTTRISTFLAVEKAFAMMIVADERRAEALIALAERREQLDEKLYEGMRSGLESSGAVQKTVREAYGGLVTPTEEESSLLEAYREALESKIAEADEKFMAETLRKPRRASGSE